MTLYYLPLKIAGPEGVIQDLLGEGWLPLERAAAERRETSNTEPKKGPLWRRVRIY
jgi:hypothetical protein